MTSRRGFLIGLGALVAAPAVVRAASLMPVRGIIMDIYGQSPIMSVLEDIKFLNIRRTIWQTQWQEAAQFILPGGIHYDE